MGKEEVGCPVMFRLPVRGLPGAVMSEAVVCVAPKWQSPPFSAPYRMYNWVLGQCKSGY